MEPLAERLRPKTIDKFIGQEHILGHEGPLKKIIEQNILPSIILWGPPGVGKTTIAHIIANTLKRPFYNLSAVSAGVKEVRDIIEKASESSHLFSQAKPIVFIDEIHRFNKSQQDSLLQAVEKGTITLIGATTENPSYEVNSALLSRCQVYVLKELTTLHLQSLIDRALTQDIVLKNKHITIKETDALFALSNGDGRKLLNIFEIVINCFSSNTIEITNEIVKTSIQNNISVFDKNGEQHYDTISALIKSIRGSDPNAAIYWLAKLIAGGEDPKFIARRLIILSSEDIGLANPNALLIANACFQAVNVIGYPECRIILSETVLYLATSPKSNSSYLAIDNALDYIKKNGALNVPLDLRNAQTNLMKRFNYGANYKYAHNYDSQFVDMEFLPTELSGTVFYEPANNIKEQEIQKNIIQNWKGKYKINKENK